MCEDLVKLREDLYNGATNMKRANGVSTALIPKADTLETPADYRPISLINTSPKIISKVL